MNDTLDVLRYWLKKVAVRLLCAIGLHDYGEWQGLYSSGRGDEEGRLCMRGLCNGYQIRRRKS